MRIRAVIAIILIIFAAGAAPAQEFSPAEEGRIKTFALEALLECPKILKEAI